MNVRRKRAWPSDFEMSYPLAIKRARFESARKRALHFEDLYPFKIKRSRIDNSRKEVLHRMRKIHEKMKRIDEISMNWKPKRAQRENLPVLNNGIVEIERNGLNEQEALIMEDENDDRIIIEVMNQMLMDVIEMEEQQNQQEDIQPEEPEMLNAEMIRFNINHYPRICDIRDGAQEEGEEIRSEGEPAPRVANIVNLAEQQQHIQYLNAQPRNTAAVQIGFGNAIEIEVLAAMRREAQIVELEQQNERQEIEVLPAMRREAEIVEMQPQIGIRIIQAPPPIIAQPIPPAPNAPVPNIAQVVNFAQPAVPAVVPPPIAALQIAAQVAVQQVAAPAPPPAPAPAQPQIPVVQQVAASAPPQIPVVQQVAAAAPPPPPPVVQPVAAPPPPPPPPAPQIITDNEWKKMCEECLEVIRRGQVAVLRGRVTHYTIDGVMAVNRSRTTARRLLQHPPAPGKRAIE